jgi:integrase
MSEQIEQGLTYKTAKMTVGEYLEGWLASITNSIRSTTAYHYKSLCTRYLIPSLKDVLIKDLTAADVQHVYDQWVLEGVPAPTIRKAHSVLHTALARAEMTGLILRNMADHARPPKAAHKEMQIWSEMEVNRFLITAREDRFYALYYLAIVTGMREMELLGLNWQDLDQARGILHVSRQLARSGGGMLDQKTKAAKRSIQVGAGTLKVLNDHHQRQSAERYTPGTQWKDTDLIFTSSIGTAVNYKNMLDRSFKPLIQAAGVPNIRFHDLRHTAASLMLNQGVPIFKVSKILGHAKPSITSDIYGHVVPNAMDGIGDMMDDLITPIESGIELKRS